MSISITLINKKFFISYFKI